MLTELAADSRYVAEGFSGDSLSDFRAAVNSPDVIYIYILAQILMLWCNYCDTTYTGIVPPESAERGGNS